MVKNILKKAYWFIMDGLPDRAAVELFYLRAFKKLPDLKNPKTFNEKIAWRKLYQRNPLFPVFADKIAVKAEVAELVGKQHLIETLWVGRTPDEIPYDALEPPYVIKVSHSSGGNIFIRTKSDIQKEETSESVYKQLKYRYAHRFREWGYLDIPPQVMVERMIEMPQGDVPEDYKFFVYHGRVHFIQVDYDRFKGHKRNIYDRDWNLLPVKSLFPQATESTAKPSSLGKMTEIAEKIGSQFDFVRVDLYSTPQGILFGETTFYPGAGIEGFAPHDWDYAFGEPWKLDVRLIEDYHRRYGQLTEEVASIRERLIAEQKRDMRLFPPPSWLKRLAMKWRGVPPAG
jgi:hypothetical protein